MSSSMRPSLSRPGYPSLCLADQEQVLASVTVDLSQVTTYFFGLAVDPDHLRKGYARYLLRSVMNQMVAEMERQFQIVVEKENHRPSAFI
ncbi:MAG: GNAT family N-acetyltransferase [Streptococcus sp.]